MMRKRFKKISKEQFSAIQKREWTPLNISHQLPAFLQNIPQDVLNSVYASGTFNIALEPARQIPSENIVGGIDVYRNAPDDPVELNKDWYAVIEDPNDDKMYLIKGPIKKVNEHWIDTIPTRLDGAEILCVPSK